MRKTNWIKFDENGEAVAFWKPAEPKMRVAMCEVYPDSAPKDWILRLRHWHVPSAISPLHDQDTYDEDKKTIMYQVDKKGELILDKEKNPIPVININGEVQMLVHHVKGEKKKAHYHVMIAYGNSTTANTFLKIIKDIGGVVPPWEHMEVCNVNSMYRYFAHLDDPDKHQYDIADVMLLGGFDPVNYQTWRDKQEDFNTLVTLIRKHPEIHSYKSLCDYLQGRDNKLFWFACNHTLFLNGYFKGND